MKTAIFVLLAAALTYQALGETASHSQPSPNRPRGYFSSLKRAKQRLKDILSKEPGFSDFDLDVFNEQLRFALSDDFEHDSRRQMLLKSSSSSAIESIELATLPAPNHFLRKLLNETFGAIPSKTRVEVYDALLPLYPNSRIQMALKELRQEAFLDSIEMQVETRPGGIPIYKPKGAGLLPGEDH